MSLENKDYSIEKLFEGSRIFEIPPYQRAFTWEIVPHITTFYEDLLNQPGDRPYYYGTLLLEYQQEEAGVEKLFIVDGQQRLTTLIIFLEQLARALERNEKKEAMAIRETFIQHESIRKFYTTNDDDAFFWSYILQGKESPSGSCDTPSKDRLAKADKFFEQQLKTLPHDDHRRLLRIVKAASVVMHK